VPDRQRILGDRKQTGERQRILGDRTPGQTVRTRVGAASPEPEKKGGDGFLGTLKHVVTQTPTDLKDAALHAPGGVVDFGKAFALDLAEQTRHPLREKGRRTRAQLKAMAEGASETLQHPLRNPGNTLLLGLPAAGSAVRTGEQIAAAGRAAKAGEGAAAVVRAATRKPEIGQRTLKVNDLEVRGHYSRASLSRGVQKATDAALQKGAEKSVRVENRLHKRASKWEQRNQRTEDAKLRSPGTRLDTLGKKLSPAELRALRLVGEETPVARRLGAQEMRKGRATHPKEQARHQERIDLTKAAMEFLDAGPDGKPVFKPEAAKLAKVFEHLKAASTDREGMLKNLGLMDDASQQAAKTKVARVAAGATYGKTETPLGIGKVKMGDKVHAPGVDGLGMVTAVDKQAGTVRVRAYDRGAKAWSEVSYPASDLGRPSKATIGAEDITASPDAVFIGNPVERSKVSGKPKVSSTGTFGRTQKPSSLKKSTGASVEHAMERNDVTRIVAERHHEAVRLTKIDRVRTRLAHAGEASPRRKDDVFVWTDKLISNERIPKEVRSYLDNPEGLQKLNPDEQLSITEQIKKAVFEQHDWRDPETVAAFEKLAKDGKGVFVSRRLMGEYAKRDFNLGQVPGVKFVDAVNNAQKLGLVYLKLNYPLIQAVSNTAMNAIQGAANPVHVTAAVKLDRAIRPETRAVIDDIAGGGAVLQAAFEGQGRIARITQKAAHIMSSKVDTPARRNAFYYEARKAGYNTPEKLEKLISDDKHSGDLGEIAQRMREAIVDYGEMSPFERGVIRRLIFVYPWQKGATKYAGHFLRDHPVQAAVGSQLAAQGKQESDNVFGAVPSYLEGLIPTGGRAVNPAGFNFFQTPAQIGQGIAGLATGNPASPEGQGFLAPFPGLAIALATQRDDIGRPLNGNLAADVRDSLITSMPVSALARAAANGHEGAAPDLVRSLVGSRASSKTFPDPNDAYWRFLLGGLYPRKYDRGALNQNAARERSGR
jgi:hypothetical protein